MFTESLFTYTPNKMNDNTPEQQVSLVKALVAFVSEAEAVQADSDNPFHKSRYASLQAHLVALKPLAKKHGLAIIQMPIGDIEAVGIRNIIIHQDGGMLSCNALVPAEKGMSGQQAGSLYSYVRRYSLASIAGIATEDDDAESDRIVKSAPKKEYVKLETKPTASGTKFIPNQTAKPFPPLGTSIGEVVAPFGDLKGTPLSQLPLKSSDRSVKFGDLNYFANVWKPKPFGDNTEISPRDLRVKAEAERLWAIANGDLPEPTATQDEVPF
jgi:hypothetical protein